MSESKKASEIMIKEMILPRMAEKNLSRHAAAKAAGMSHTTLNRWIKGDLDLTIEKFLSLLAVLDINIRLVPKEIDNIKYKNRITF